MASKDPEYLYGINDQLKEMRGIIEEVAIQIDHGLSDKKLDLEPRLTELCKEAEIKEEQTVELCTEALIRYQPFASDLRAITVAIKVAYDLTRICRYLRNISDVQEDFDIQFQDPLLLELFRKAKGMVSRSLDAYFASDARAAKAIINDDEEIDEGYRAIARKYAASTTAPGECILFNGITARIIERLADQACYICHETIYLVTARRSYFR